MAERNLSLEFAAAPKKQDEAPPSARPKGGDAARPLSIGELSRAFKGAVERLFPTGVWMEGEVTSAKSAPSGHLYFALADEAEEAIVDAVVYKRDLTERSRALVKPGAKIRLHGRASYWAPRGKLQVVGDRIEPSGKGALLEALERLKERLQAEGLFAQERKRGLPKDPRIIGVVTSAGGAVIHDICKVAFRRGGAKILLSPALVQGAGAAESIKKAIDLLAKIPGVDVVIVGRGGGSTEDLMVWNDEGIVRRVFAYPVPVVSAIGHEVDVTLTDFVADARAATPSQAAEMVVADDEARRDAIRERKVRLVRAMRAIGQEERARLVDLSRRLGDPRLAIAGQQQLLDDRRMRLEDAIEARLRAPRDALRDLERRLAERNPRTALVRERAQVDALAQRLRVAAEVGLARKRSALESAALSLDAMSPLKVLGRGYAIARKDDGSAIRNAAEAKPGERIRVRVAEGEFAARVEEE